MIKELTMEVVNMKNKFLFYLFAALAISLSNVMCAVVAYNYCSMQWGIRYAGYSAPANTAFFLIIPYAIGIVICAVLSRFFHKRSEGYTTGVSM